MLYINDIVESINFTIRLFANDTSLYLIADNPTEAADKLNADQNTFMGIKMVGDF